MGVSGSIPSSLVITSRHTGTDILSCPVKYKMYQNSTAFYTFLCHFSIFKSQIRSRIEVQSRIPIRTKIESRIRIRIKVNSLERWRLTKEPCRLTLEPQRDIGQGFRFTLHHFVLLRILYGTLYLAWQLGTVPNIEGANKLSNPPLLAAVAALCNRLRMALTPRGLKAENIKLFQTHS